VATKTRRTKNSSAAAPKDPATQYARDVLAGRIIVGPYVRAACQRHCDDLTKSTSTVLAVPFPFFWDVDAAQTALDWFPEVLTVEDATDGVVAFHLLDWQVFCTGSLFGWRRKANGLRRFRKAYIESGKGSGKTPWAAGIGLFMQLADGEQSAEVYATAAKREQAMILFGDVVKMVDRSVRLRNRLQKSGRNPVWQLLHRATGSIFKPLSADKKKSGLRVSCGIVDELHEVQDRYTVDMLQDGFKGRKQPLLLAITNAGFDRTTICWEWHEHAVAVVEGMRVDDELFAYVMALDPGDDPLELDPKKTKMLDVGGELVPECWVKTNPGLGKTITVEYLRSAVSDAIAIPGRENVIRRLNFCEWTDADKGWITRATWTAIEAELVDMVKPVKGTSIDGPGEIKVAGRSPGSALPGMFGVDEFGLKAHCTLGIDLSFAFDLTALALCFPEPLLTAQGHQLIAPNGQPMFRYACWVEYFTPKDTARNRESVDRVPYVRWIDHGLVHGVEGSVVRIEHVAARIAEISGQFEVDWAAYDKYRHKTLADEMAEQGVNVPWIEHPQGFRRAGVLDGKGGNPLIIGLDGKPLDNPLWMPGSVDTLEGRIIEKTLEVQVSEVTRWNVSSVVIRNDPAGTGNRVFNKAKAVGRIDGVVALAMAVGAAEMRLPKRSLAGFLANPVMTK
jgi:phage terminase large subunit-like protein